MGADRLRRIHDPIIPDPELLYQVKIKNGNGYFPHLSSNLVHGFSWGNPQNLSYRAELNVVTNLETERNAHLRVRGRIRGFLQTLGIQTFENLITIAPSQGDLTIVDLTRKALRETEAWPDERGRYIQGGAIFTQLPETPIFALANDCVLSIIEAQTPNLTPVVGLAHAGRREVELGFPKQVINYLEARYGCDPEEMKIGILPSLEPEFHFISFDTLGKDIQNFPAWRYYKDVDPRREVYYLDVRSWVADQYIESGVQPQNIQLSLVGTYEAARKGLTFSYRYSSINLTKQQAAGLAIELRD